MSDEEKAKQYIAEAEKKVKSSGGLFSGLFGGGGSSKIDEAVDLYCKAANAYKMAKNWSAAGNAFGAAAELQLNKQKNKHEAATIIIDAANCVRKVNQSEAVQLFMRAIEIYTDMGRFTIAARHHQTIGEIYETELNDLEKASKHYEQAADYYKGEESNSSANKCWNKVAHLAAQLDQFEKAAKLFEDIGKSCTENKLLVYGAKEYFFKAVLCQLAIDAFNAQMTLGRCEELHPAFADSREYKLVKLLVEARNENSVDKFTDAVRDFDAVTRMDPWLTKLCLKIKKQFAGEGEFSLQ